METKKIVFAKLQPKVYVEMSKLKIDPNDKDFKKKFKVEADKILKEVYPEEKFKLKEYNEMIQHMIEFYIHVIKGEL